MVHSLSDPAPRDPDPLHRVRLSGSVRLPPGYEPALFLFTPRGEKLWADGWDPLFPAPADDDTEPGTVFETLHGQQRTTWVVCARDPGRSVRYARIAHGRDAGTVTVTLDDGAAAPRQPRVATVDYDLTALTGEAAAGLARFAAGYPGYLRHWEAAIAAAIRTGTPVVPDDGPGLFTIGHSNQALDHFLSLLQRHGIEAVADVRTVPWSRYVPHFNAKTLGAALASQGIDYVPLGRELGGRPAGDEFYDEQGHVLYGRLAASPAFQDGLDQVLARGRTSRIALLCAEEDPARCHRHLLIGPVLRQRGVPVSHIRRDGRTETEADLAASDSQPTLLGDDPRSP